MKLRIVLLSVALLTFSCKLPMSIMPSHAVWHYYNYKIYSGSNITINNINYHESLWVINPESNDRHKFHLRATDLPMVNRALSESGHNGFNLTTREVNGILTIESIQAVTMSTF